VDRATIDTAVREVVDEESIDDGESCRAAAEKRMRALRAYEPEVQRRRLTGFLLRRGFSGSVVSATVRAVLRGTPDSDD
jgi:regulatory protein